MADGITTDKISVFITDHIGFTNELDLDKSRLEKWQVIFPSLRFSEKESRRAWKTEKMFKISQEIFNKTKYLRKRIFRKNEKGTFKAREYFELKEKKLQKYFEVKCKKYKLL